MKKKLKINKKKCIYILIIFVFLVPFIVDFYIETRSKSNIYFNKEEDIAKLKNENKQYEVGIILGAYVFKNSMSDILYDRTVTALELYKKKCFKKFLISGDHGRPNYDEVNTVKNFLIREEVPEEDIFTDYAGFDTYDSMYRAKHIFEVNSAIIFTQEFHLSRSVYIAENVGLEVKGVVSDIQGYNNMRKNEIREFFAKQKAFFDVLVKSKPTFGGETIPISGDGRNSWDKSG